MTGVASPAAPSAATPAALRFTGYIADLTAAQRRALFDRGPSSDAGVRARTAEIIHAVRAGGDDALRALALELDGVTLDALEVPRASWRKSLDAIDPALRRAMERAARNIAAAHRACLPQLVEVETEPGVVIGRRPDALRRVGIYAPGGTASYPSSVLMAAVPARVAGVDDVVICSPPGPNGEPAAAVLAAAELAGANRVFAIGGAGAIAAMAFGTQSVPRVDRIVGPGNAYVAEAKLQVAGAVAIDAPAGPSELLIVSDTTSSAHQLALEMAAQAEHDVRAAALAIVTSEAMASALRASLDAIIATASRADIVRESLAARGGVLIARSADEAVAFASEYAAEHLLLSVADAEQMASRVRNTGAVFVGGASSVSFGDYMTGGNHVLPTGGLARSYSGLSVNEFYRWTSYQRVTTDAAARLAHDVALFAEAEGLPGHAAAARFLDHTPNRTPRIDPIRQVQGARLVDLSDNTSLFGPAPAGARELRRTDPASLSRYPSAMSPDLKRAIADYIGCDDACVTTGNGSDDVIDSAFRTLAEPGDTVAFCDPTFSMVPFFAKRSRLESRPVPFLEDGQVDVDALLATRARIIYLCSPNNPTGMLAPRAAIERLIENAPGFVILDEAYAEFGGVSDAARATRLERLLVVRTMSKAFGLAGARVGYAVGSADLARAMEAGRAPYAVNVAGERAAAAALREERDWMNARVQETIAIRERVMSALRDAGLRPLPSDANFVLVPVAGADAVARRMRADGVLVRVFRELPPCSAGLRASFGDAIRITVGPWDLMEAALASLARALKNDVSSSRAERGICTAPLRDGDGSGSCA